jgi:hypothetical protein
MNRALPWPLHRQSMITYLSGTAVSTRQSSLGRRLIAAALFVLRHGEEHGGVLQRLQDVPSLRHDEQVARPPMVASPGSACSVCADPAASAMIVWRRACS